MCGWIGIFGARCEQAVIERAAATLISRGPDGSGERVVDDGPLPFAVGHRRLAILDPTPAGAQPMVDEEHGLSVVYNGELYNYPDLRRRLEASGHRFRSGTDTEALLTAFAEWGDDALSHLEGMFSFALVDERRGRVILARDRLGIKPLYYAEVGGALVAGSAPRALLALRPGLGAERDRVALAQYLALLWIPHPRTLWRSIRKLEPGRLLTYERGCLRASTYWSLSRRAGEVLEPERLLGAIERSTVRQLLSDVPVGTLLSGGLDSTLLISLVARHDPGQLVALTAGYDAASQELELAPDDLGYARQVAAAEPRVQLQEVEIGGAAHADLDSLAMHFDDPVADPAAISLLRLVRASPTKVLLSGVGGEELFAGYPRHLALGLARRAASLPGGVRRAGGTLAPALRGGMPGPLYGPRRNLQKLLRATGHPETVHYWRMVAQLTFAELHALVPDAAGEAWAELDGLSAPLARASLADALEFDMGQFLPNLNLAYVDKASMAAGVEVRVPLLDEEVVASASVSTAGLVAGGMGKVPLRAASRGVVADVIIDRPKAGFGGPVRGWFQGEGGAALEARIRALGETGLVDAPAAQRVFDDARGGRQDLALAAWSLACLQAWQGFYGEVGHAAPPAKTQVVSFR
ncbi:MAG: asparagine synthase (glutamine-hydrolyzing) [Acidimicrobiales bacterium]